MCLFSPRQYACNERSSFCKRSQRTTQNPICIRLPTNSTPAHFVTHKAAPCCGGGPPGPHAERECLQNGPKCRRLRLRKSVTTTLAPAFRNSPQRGAVQGHKTQSCTKLHAVARTENMNKVITEDTRHRTFARATRFTNYLDKQVHVILPD